MEQVAIYNVGKRQLVEWQLQLELQLRSCGRSSWIGLCSAQRHTKEGDSLSRPCTSHRDAVVTLLGR